MAIKLRIRAPAVMRAYLDERGITPESEKACGPAYAPHIRSRAHDGQKGRRGEFHRDRLPDWPTYAASQGLQLVGAGKWCTTRCDFHEDRSPSLRVNTASGGWCCMSCGESGGDTLAHYMRKTGKAFIEAARDLGAWTDGGKVFGFTPSPSALPASDALTLVYHDAMLIWVAAANLANGVALSDQDRADLGAAARRILLAYEGTTR